MASRTSTPRTRSPSTSSDSSDTTMLDAPTHVPLTPTRLRQPSLTHSAPSAQAAAAAAAADPAFSLLLSLPRELRDRVYAFALTSPYPFWWPGQAPMQHNVAVRLLQTSRQVHDEAAPLLYTANKFLFTHPSDCTVFRVVASPHAESIHSVYFRIREKDLPLWTKYLGSKKEDRCLKHDLPHLRTLCIFLRCGSAGTPRFFGQGALPPAMAVHVQAVQNALGQQVAALQQQVHHLAHPAAATLTPNGPPVIVPTGAPAGLHHAPAPAPSPAPAPDDAAGDAHAAVPPPPPPPPPVLPAAIQPFANFTAGMPHALPQANHNILATFLRHERELGIESLCLSLRETLHDAGTHYAPPNPAELGGRRERRAQDRDAARRNELDHRENRRPHANKERDDSKRDPPDVKIVCIMRVPKHDVSRLVRLHPDELTVDRNGDARTRFRRLHGADICVEISGFDGVQG